MAPVGNRRKVVHSESSWKERKNHHCKRREKVWLPPVGGKRRLWKKRLGDDKEAWKLEKELECKIREIR